MSTTSRGCVTARPARWPTASTPPSGRRKVTAEKKTNHPAAHRHTEMIIILITLIFSRRSVLPLHEGDRESGVSCQIVGEGGPQHKFVDVITEVQTEGATSSKFSI